MTLRAHVVVQRGQLAVDVDLTVGEGEVLAVLGPNGAGKSTVLRVLAGLLTPDAGRVALDGDTVWDDGDVHLPAHRRSLGMVFQDHLLFPHLTITDNVAFGLRTRGIHRAAARTTAEAWLARVGLDGLGGRRPAQLSGGQAQRAALARALVEAGFLQRHPDVAAGGVGVDGHVDPSHASRAGRDRHQCGQHAHGGRLPGAVRPEEAEDLARRHLQIHAPHGLDGPAPPAEPLDQLLRFDGKRHLADPNHTGPVTA